MGVNNDIKRVLFLIEKLSNDLLFRLDNSDYTNEDCISLFQELVICFRKYLKIFGNLSEEVDSDLSQHFDVISKELVSSVRQLSTELQNFLKLRPVEKTSFKNIKELESWKIFEQNLSDTVEVAGHLFQVCEELPSGKFLFRFYIFIDIYGISKISFGNL